jgi:hypothetical protein
MAIPNWLLGRHVTAVQVAVQTLNESTGALANAGVSAVDVSNIVLTTGSHSSGTIAFTNGLLNEIRLSSDRSVENINPVNRTFAHYVPILQGYDITVSEVMRSGVALCLLANVWFGGDTNYILFSFARGGNKWAGYFIMTGYSETIQRGKNVAMMTLTSVDNGAVTYTAADR